MQVVPSRQNLFILLIIAGLILLAFWLRLDRLDHFPPGLSNDEAVNTVDAFHFARTGNFPLYEDANRPEPLHRIILGVNALLFGTSVWAFRFTSVLIGTLTVAAVYQTTCECLHDLKPAVRRLAGLTAAASLTVALGHITQSRIIERGTLQLPFMLFFASFLLRGIRLAASSASRSRTLRYFALSGLCLGIVCYTYTAALVLPAAVGVVGLSLLLFHRASWRKWFPALIVLGLVFAVVVAPVGLLLLSNPITVVGRAAQVSQAGNWLQQFIAFWGQFFTQGDENPQYNVASAPVLPPIFMYLFVVGLIALLARPRRPSSWLIAAFLVLSAVPVIAANELTHGLRIIGEFAAFPLTIGVGVGLVLTLLPRIRLHKEVWGLRLSFVALLFLALTNAAYAHQTYDDYWVDTGNIWKVYDRELTHGEWFYRTDRRDLAEWIASQHQSLLIPVDELAAPTTRTWLMSAYPAVDTAGDDFLLPANTRLVLPWSLELGDLRREARHYALLHQGRITLLPPFSTETRDRLLMGIDEADSVIREGDISLIARYRDLPDATPLTFEPRTISADPIATFGDQQMALLGWRGADTITSTDPQILTYTLDWCALRQLGHEYSVFLQLQTHDGEKIAGDDVRILRWLFPTTIWGLNDVVPDMHRLDIPADLSPGAYRLVAGLYGFVTPDQHLPVFSPTGERLDSSLTTGWIKVPQRELPYIDETAVQLNAVFDDTFALREASATRGDDGKIHLRLIWESMVERPPVDATIFIHVANANGDIIAQDDSRPWNGQYPTFIWGENEIVQTDHVLDIGASSPDDLTVFVGMYTFPSLERLPVIQDGRVVEDSRVRVGSLGGAMSGSE
jgi:hypothetical protein